MRILRVAQKVYPEVKGGGPYHVHAMSRDQAAMGHEVTVLTLDPNGDKLYTEERDGYTVIRYPATVSALGNDISAGLASYLRKADDFDVIHAHSHLYFSTNLAALKRAVGGPPLAITNHGLYSQNAPEWLFDLYLRSIGRWTFNRADVVFCYTETDKQRVRNFGVGSRIEVVSNGIDTERFTPDGLTSEYINTDGPVLLFVGRIVDGKRPWDAVSALAEVRETYPDAELYFCGEGPLRAQLEEQANNLSVGNAVTFLGHLPYDEMPKIYRSADVLVLPSRAEGVPRTVLEAMSSGVPVVCSHLDQLDGIVDGRGALVSISDVNQLGTEIIEWIESDEELEPLEGSHAWQTTVEQTTERLRSLVH